MKRVLVIWLDGYEFSFANANIRELPSLAKVRERSARFLLDDGLARLTGLTEEHVSSGLAPDDAGRWSIVHFDRETYGVWQEGPLFAPFPSKMDADAVVFDFPYFDLSRAPRVRGAVAWGAHNAGMEFSTNPKSLLDEILKRHGAYPANQWMYDLAWPSAERCEKMGDGLANAVDVRSKIAMWLLKERFPDWQLALISVSESHSALESLWHGIDGRHPLHSHSSTRAAAAGIHKVYQAIDRLVGSLSTEFEDATIVLFSMHGMGPNTSDVPSMILLPELLHRYAFGRAFFVQPDSWTRAANGIPNLRDGDNWDVITPDLRPFPSRFRDQVVGRVRHQVARLLPKHLKDTLKRRLARITESYTEGGPASSRKRISLEWMPAARYQPFWSQMRAFALPSFHDGQIRINLQGRERNGIVPLEQYKNCCAEIAQLLKDCRDPISGDGAVAAIEGPVEGNPLTLAATKADIYVSWNQNVLCLEHRGFGRIGPVPFGRTGGHTGHYGMAYLRSDIIAPGDYGVRSSFDVVPTLFGLLDEQLPDKIYGRSLIHCSNS